MITVEQKAKFIELSGQLSPENLTCDGELSKKEVQQRLRAIQAVWRALEDAVGETVTEDMTWNWYTEVSDWRAVELQKQIDLFPKHPLLDSNSPGFWFPTGNKFTYTIRASATTPMEFQFNTFMDFEMGFKQNEHASRFDSLEAAIAGAEDFLRSITAEKIKAIHPKWLAENVEQRMKKLKEAGYVR